MAALANSYALLSVESLPCWALSHLGKGTRASVCPSVEGVRAPTHCLGKFMRVLDVDMPQGGVRGNVGVPISGLAFTPEDPPALHSCLIGYPSPSSGPGLLSPSGETGHGRVFSLSAPNWSSLRKTDVALGAADGERLPNPERGLRCARVAKVFTERVTRKYKH